MQHRTLWAFASILILAAAAACGGSDAPAEAPAEPAAPAFDPATAGNVTGSIMLEGEPPAAEMIRMNSDPVCVKQATDNETNYYVVGEGGGLGNVFVYVKEGLQVDFPPASDTVILDQQGCRYMPHVFGIQVGQTLQVVNSDPTLHNIHATPANNPEFNTGQPIQGMTFDRTFDNVEVMVPFKCDVHGWMNAYLGVLDHPFFAVTAPDGSFDLSGLPPGDYVIEAWHEELGTQTQNVTVAEGGTAEMSLTFTV
ncbi:MAG: carboxypeptidase regulatory-like domain-containing protein, partial [Acidobacteria bacterium]|nr:carboxypeptidase regulatory-like domain-containing protein [Acidobacteriota bacterium]